MEKEVRRPAGVDPAALEVRPELPAECDAVMAEGKAIGRRVAWKLFPSGGSSDQGTGDRERFDCIAEVVEAEVRSTWGTPAEGEVIVRLQYAEVVQTLAALVEAMDGGLGPWDRGVVARARRKFFLAIGVP